MQMTSWEDKIQDTYKKGGGGRKLNGLFKSAEIFLRRSGFGRWKYNVGKDARRSII